MTIPNIPTSLLNAKLCALILSGELAEQVVAVLSALRGPDDENQNHKLKYLYTTPIRCWAFNKTTRQLIPLGMSGGREAPTAIEDWRALCATLNTPFESHYIYHLRIAISGIIAIEQHFAKDRPTAQLG